MAMAQTFRLRIVNRPWNRGRLIIGVWRCTLKIPEGYTLTLMLITNSRQLPDIAQTAATTVGCLTATAVYTLQLLYFERRAIHPSASYRYPLLVCLIAFGGTVWLWPQWQSGLRIKTPMTL